MIRHPFVEVFMLAAMAGAAFGAGPARQQVQARQSEIPQGPVQQQMINLNLINALVAIHQENLAGLFGYIAEQNAAPAFAEYLFRSPDALKLFVKKDEKDLKGTGGIDEWDKAVFLYVVGLNSNGEGLAGGPTLSPKMMERVSALSLAPAMSLSDLTMRRKH